MPAGAEGEAKEIAGDRFIPPAAERLTVRELLGALESDLLMRGAKSIVSFPCSPQGRRGGAGRPARITSDGDEIRGFNSVASMP
jgi:hypothetical protein